MFINIKHKIIVEMYFARKPSSPETVATKNNMFHKMKLIMIKYLSLSFSQIIRAQILTKNE